MLTPRTMPALAAGYAAASWLLALTALNLMSHGEFRSTLLFAVPVGFAAWRHWHVGFLFAAAAVLCAWIGGALPEPGSQDPPWLDAIVAFAKLSIDALVVHAWAQRHRRRGTGR